VPRGAVPRRTDVDALPSCSIAESSQVARLRRGPRMARSLTDPLTSWDDARDTLFTDWLFGQVIGLVEEVPQGFDDQIGCLFGQEVTGGQRGTADVGGVLLPDAERLVAASDEGLRPPQG
jgi:hypothetical protein